MILTILVAWLVLAGLAALFLYCCSRVSEGVGRELTAEDFTGELTRRTTRTWAAAAGAAKGDRSAPLSPSSSASLTLLPVAVERRRFERSAPVPPRR